MLLLLFFHMQQTEIDTHKHHTFKIGKMKTFLWWWDCIKLFLFCSLSSPQKKGGRRKKCHFMDVWFQSKDFSFIHHLSTFCDLRFIIKDICLSSKLQWENNPWQYALWYSIFSSFFQQWCCILIYPFLYWNWMLL